MITVPTGAKANTQSAKIRLDQGYTRRVKPGKGVTQGCLLLILLNLHNEYLIKKALEEFGYFIQGGQAISSVKCADDFVPQAEEETVIQSMADTLNETGI
jgi:hypothetical protein